MSERIEDYIKACEDYEEYGPVLHDILYKLCREHPNHSSNAAILAKLCVIGRGYATGIERQVLSTGKQSDTLMQLIEHFYKNRKSIDTIFKRLSLISGPLTSEKLKLIVREHGRFVKLLSHKLRKNRSARSFASKYMHFHCPSVPIYDSFVNKILRREYRWNDKFMEFEIPSDADEEYYAYVCRFWQLYQELKKACKGVNVKLVDNYLMSLTEN